MEYPKNFWISFEGFLSELKNDVLSLPSSTSSAFPAHVPAAALFTMGRKEEPEGGTKEKDPVSSLNGKPGSRNVPSVSNNKKETNKTFSFPSE